MRELEIMSSKIATIIGFMNFSCSLEQLLEAHSKPRVSELPSEIFESSPKEMPLGLWLNST